MYEPSPEDTALRPLPRLPARRAADADAGVRALIARYFFQACALVSALATLLFVWLPRGLQAEQRIGIVAAHAAVALAAAAAALLRPARTEAAMFAVLALAVAVIAGTALAVGWGIAGPSFGFYGVFVCVTCAAAGRRWGLALALLAAVALLLVDAAARALPAMTAVTAAGREPLRLLSLLLVVAVGYAAGVLVSTVLGTFVRSADDREQRFRGLLAIAADAYWEVDRDYRLATITDQRDENRALTAERGLGRVPWDLPQFGCDADTLDTLLADLDTRVPFRDLQVAWQARSGEVRLYLVSGEPRFDERGVFTGYWGVARDVSDAVAAREALAATETRYQELFARIPTPLVLHQGGRIVDANAAGLALFGFDSIDAMAGRDLLAFYESGDSRERARRRLDDLTGAEPGSALPVSDFRLVARSGRRLQVRDTSVQVLADGGAASLSIYVDDTDRRTAEDAVRRSETMLSHLVATSPDVITLTDLESGRYAMVNDTFARVTGYEAADVVGKTSAELGVWARPGDRERFVDALHASGSVADMPTDFRAKDGHVVSMLVSGARFRMDRRDYLVINARDVTETERGRREREAILENASIGIAVTKAGRFVLANPRFEQMFGWPPGGLVGKDADVVWPDAASHCAFVAAYGARLGRGEPVELEAPARRRDGSTFLARLLAKVIDPAAGDDARQLYIVDDVTAQRRSERALADARDAAEAASRAKSAFLANTSHELRTPLNGMLHLAELARDPALDARRRDQYLQQLADSARSLAGIISDILDLSKIEAGRLALETVPFDLAELLAAVQHGYATLAAARGLALEVALGADLDGWVDGDALRVRQIVSNFVSNAIKFTDDGHVRIAARRLDATRVRIEVHDTGPGIAADLRERLFRPFTQADESTTRRFGGTGLGLSICREMARTMGGEVGVDSGSAGSVFWAELPLPRAAAPAPAAAAPHDARVLAGAHVLMVEDNAVNMLIAVALLERWGVRVEQAIDGEQAIAAVRRAGAAGEPFDAVLMDVQMPVMSGYEATRALRRESGGGRVPVIALTAAALVSEREAALAAGMDDFLTKPIDADKLRTTLARWVGLEQA